MRDFQALLRPLTAAVEELLFPPTCAGCGARGAWLCDSCLAALRAVPRPTCRCGRPARSDASVCTVCAGWPAGLGRVRAAFVFEGPLRESIHRFKYQRERARGEFLGKLLAQYANEPLTMGDGPPDVVVPIPLHPQRERARGFNQAAVLAAPVARTFGVPVRPVLRRTAETQSQVGLGFNARRRNVARAFHGDAGAIDGARVLLIDDVVTTGATFEAAARALLAAGAVRVDGLALAREL